MADPTDSDETTDVEAPDVGAADPDLDAGTDDEDRTRRVGWRHEWGTLALLWAMVLWGAVTVAMGGFGIANLIVILAILGGGAIGSLVIVDASKIPMRVVPPERRSERKRGTAAESEGESEADPELKADPEPEAKAEPEPDPEAEAKAEPEEEPEAKPEAEPEAAEPEAEAKSEPESESEGEADSPGDDSGKPQT